MDWVLNQVSRKYGVHQTFLYSEHRFIESTSMGNIFKDLENFLYFYLIELFDESCTTYDSFVEIAESFSRFLDMIFNRPGVAGAVL